jgi:hypothetical protein
LQMQGQQFSRDRERDKGERSLLDKRKKSVLSALPNFRCTF